MLPGSLRKKSCAEGGEKICESEIRGGVSPEEKPHVGTALRRGAFKENILSYEKGSV